MDEDKEKARASVEEGVVGFLRSLVICALAFIAFSIIKKVRIKSGLLQIILKYLAKKPSQNP